MATKAKQSALAAKTRSEGESLIRNEKLKQLYIAMLQCRLLEQRASMVWNSPRPFGREATEVGCTIDLRTRDAIATSNEDWLSRLLQKVPLRTHLGGRQRSRHELGAQPVEHLIASADKVKTTKNVVVAFADDSRPSELQPALERAGSKSLPIIFVRRDNLSAKPNGAGRGLSNFRTEDYGFPGIPVDGHDVVAIYRVAHEAIQRARRGGGPTLIDCETYLLQDGAVQVSKSSSTQGSRSRLRHGSQNGGTARLAPKPTRDPVQQMEEYLIGKGLFQNAWKQRILRDFSQKLDAALGTSPKTDLDQYT